MKICYHDWHHLLTQIAALGSKLDMLTTQGEVMSAQLDALKTAVEAENTVIDSAITLLNGLSAQITALKDDPVALQALADEVAAKATTLSDAVAANTPAAP